MNVSPALEDPVDSPRGVPKLLASNLACRSSSLDMRWLCLSVFLLFPLASCTKPSHGWTGTIEDSAGVTIVRNPAEGVWQPGEEWKIEEEVRIGTVEGAAEYQFVAILRGGVAVDSQGRIFVLDVAVQEIRLFSPEGEYVSTLATRGEGPGELKSARDLVMGPGDTLFVPDWGNQRMNRFAPDGSFAGDARFWPRREGLSITFRANSAGLIVEQVNSFVQGNPDPENPRYFLIRWAAGRSRSDTLAGFPAEVEVVDQPWYAPQPCWDVTEAGGLLLGVTDQYRFSLISSDGVLGRIVTRAYEPHPVSQEDIERAVSHLEARWKRMGLSPSTQAELSAQQHFNEFFPAFRALYVGPSGTTWVQKPKPPSEIVEGEVAPHTWPSDWARQDWDVFDPDGRFLGAITMPPRFTPAVFSGDRIYGVSTDELGIPWVVQFRLAKNDLGPIDTS
jgi:hypothetical protein